MALPLAAPVAYLNELGNPGIEWPYLSTKSWYTQITPPRSSLSSPTFHAKKANIPPIDAVFVHQGTSPTVLHIYWQDELDCQMLTSVATPSLFISVNPAPM